MPSRAVRKRARRRQARQQATASPNIVERWGWAEPTDLVPGDLALIRRAIRERWNIPDATRPQVVAAIMRLLDSRSGIMANEYMRDSVTIGAVRVVIDMEWANMLLDRDTLQERRRLIRGILPGWDAWRHSLAETTGWPTNLTMKQLELAAGQPRKRAR
jgi:hypothetical protein